MGKKWSVESSKQTGRACFGNHKCYKLYRRIGEESCFTVGPKIKFSTTFNFAEPINSEHDKWLKPENARVKNVAAMSKLPRSKKRYIQDRLLGYNLLDVWRRDQLF